MSAFDLLSYDAEKDKLVFGGHVFVFGESQSQRKFVGALLEAKGRPMPAHEIAGHISQHCDMHQIPRIFQNVLNRIRHILVQFYIVINTENVQLVAK